MIEVVTEEMHESDCVKKRRKAHAVQKMKVGPSESSCRRGLQTAMSCFQSKAAVVNVMVKRRDLRLRHVEIGETNASEPMETYRKCKDDIETRASD
jgi:hypothetical protein